MCEKFWTLPYTVMNIDFSKIISELLLFIIKAIATIVCVAIAFYIFRAEIDHIEALGIKIFLKEEYYKSKIEDAASGNLIVPSHKTTVINNLMDEFSRHKKLKQGYIFIGNFDKNNWESKMFHESFSTPYQIKEGDSISLRSNMYVRSQMPINDSEYFKNIKSLGIVNKNTKVRIIEKPEGIKRAHATQWWAKIEFMDDTI